MNDVWHLLFSRTGKHPADGDEQEISYAALEESRVMTEQEGRSAFRFWIAGGAALCLTVAIGTVSCAHREAEAASEGGRIFWIAVLVIALSVILTVIAVDFTRAWKAQKNLEARQKKAILSMPADVFARFRDRQPPERTSGNSKSRIPEGSNRQNEGQ